MKQSVKRKVIQINSCQDEFGNLTVIALTDDGKVYQYEDHSSNPYAPSDNTWVELPEIPQDIVTETYDEDNSEDDGWISWDGSRDAPENLKEFSYIKVECRGGGIHMGYQCFFDWTLDGGPYDIIAYKIIEEE